MISNRTPFVQLAAFLLASAAVATYIAFVLGDVSFTPTRSYHAMFTSASGMKSGSPVRIAGVDVGKVDSVALHDGDRIEVGFTVDKSFSLTTRSTATIRYKNLIGDRFLELSRGSGAGSVLSGGSTMPTARTSPALDLDTLLNGFKPLFAGLDPTSINALSMEIVQVFQGESGNVATLLGRVASLTSTLADRDELIGSVITNLNTTLSTVSAHGADLDTLIVQLQQLISGLSADRDPIVDALVHINRLAASATDLLATVRPDLAADVSQVRTLATTLNKNSDTIVDTVRKLPHAYKLLARLGAYGNFFNFYYCSISVEYTSPLGGNSVYQGSPNKAARCKG